MPQKNKLKHYAFLKHQQDWVADKSAVKIAEKSRRVGITWAEAGDDVLIASTAKGEGGDDVWYIGYNKDMAKEYINTCAEWAETIGDLAADIEEDVIRDEDKDIVTYCIKFASGFKITALSSRPSNLRGKQGVVVIDEAAFHDDLDELLKAAFALLIWGGKVRIISTHNGVENHFNEIIEKTRAGKTNYSIHRITFDDALEAGLYERICLVKKMPNTAEAKASWIASIKKMYAHNLDEELNCIPKHGGGSYLSYSIITKNMDESIPVLRLSVKDSFTELPEKLRVAEMKDWCETHLRPLLDKLNPDLRHAFGEDFGRTLDLTVFCIFEILTNMKRRAPFIVELRNMPHEQQKQILFYILDRLPRFMGGIMDAGGNGSYLAEVTALKYGSRIEQLKLSREYYRENMPKYKAGLEDDDIILPKDDEITTDHQAIEVIDGVPRIGKKRTGGAGNKRHGDGAIACFLGYIATITKVNYIEFEAVGNERISAGMEDYL